MDYIARTNETIPKVRENLDREIFSPPTFSRQATLVIWSAGAAALATGVATIANLEGAIKVPINSAYLVPFLGCSLVCVLASFLLSVSRDLSRVRTAQLKAYLLHLPLMSELREECAETVRQMAGIPEIHVAAAQIGPAEAKERMERLLRELEQLKSAADDRAQKQLHDRITLVILEQRDYEAVNALEAEVDDARSRYWREIEKSLQRSAQPTGLYALQDRFDLAIKCMEQLNRPFLDFFKMRRISIFVECVLPTALAVIAIFFVLAAG